jgi:hypothetical protein
MARKRRAPNYAGALAQPIYLEDHYKNVGGLGQSIWERDIDALRTVWASKMQLLFKHYEIDPSDEQCWQKLATSLALAHVPGLQVVENRPKPGRKPTWKTGLDDEFVRAVEVKSRTGKSTMEAIDELRKEPRWKHYSRQNLAARYRESRRRQRVLASLQEDWEKGIFFGVDPAAPSTTAPPLGRLHEDD